MERKHMTTERTRIVWLEARTDYSVTELIELSGLPAGLVDELVDCGALPFVAGRDPPVFGDESIALAHAARRLREHFELDDHGVAVAVSLLRRVRSLERELSVTRATAIFD
jgi:chaperone modulatory protein CbpM